MSERKKIKEKQTSRDLIKRIKKLVIGLYYISETDSEILTFEGEKAESVTKEVLLVQTGMPLNSSVEERNFEEFFSPVIEIQDWFGDEEKQITKQFLALKELLQEKLRDLKVFKVGKIELDIYVVGLDSQGILMGVKTKAVET